MPKKQPSRTATVGVVEHGNSAILMTLTTGAEVLDRRRIDLTDESLPTHPYHHEGSWAVGRYKDSAWARDISLPDAIKLVQQVHEAAAEGARSHLAALAAALSVPVGCIAIRQCPELPATIEERIRDHRAQAVADSVMYRQALAAAAGEQGWSVVWYDRDQVFHDAAVARGCKDIKPLLATMGKSLGPPWQAKHKLATAAALAAIPAAAG